jgi:PAS domain S-box-containing protein
MPRRPSESLVTKRKNDESLLRPASRPFEPQAEASLREHAELLNLTHDAMFVRDMGAAIKYWNRGAEEMYGWTAEEALGKSALELLKTISSVPLEQIDSQVLRTGRWEGELVHHRRNGTPVVVASRLALQRDEQGAPVAILATTTDITERKRVEQARQDLEEQWRAAFEANPTMYFIIDAAGVILSVNPVGAEQLGWDVAELIGQPVLNVFHEADRAFVQGNADQAFRQPGRVMRWKARKVRKDGSMLWVRESANAVVLRSRPVLLVACEDITERKHAEDALRESEERFRTLVQFSFDVYWESDAQHRFTRQEYSARFGRAPAPGSEIGKTRWEVPYLEPDEEAWRQYRAALDAHVPFRDFELARSTPGGGKRHVSVSGLPMFDEAGCFIGYRGVGRDITERKRAEEALRRSEKELREVLETMPAIAFVTNADGSGVLVNRRGSDYTGFSPSGWNWQAAVHPEDLPGYLEARTKRMATGEPFEQEARFRRADGEYRWFLSRAVPVRSDDGSILKWYGVLTDIEDRKRAEEERRAHMWFLESMNRVNRAMQGTNDLEKMMSDVLEAVLEIFACDRAWLTYPCDPEAARWRAVMEQARPEFPGAFSLGADLPLDTDVATVFRTARAASGAVSFGPGCELQLPAQLTETFSIRSVLAMALYPKGDQPYLFGLHQCSRPRAWTTQEERLFEEIGHRLADALTSLLIFRSLRESERKLEEAQRMAHLGHWEADLDIGCVTASEEAFRIHGLRRPESGQLEGRLLDLVHPDDRERVEQANEAGVQGGPRFDMEYRVVRPDGKVRVVHNSADVARDPSGRPRRFFGIVQDMTELRHAEEELRESESRYRHIFQGASVSIWEEDLSAVEAAIDALKAQGVRDFRRHLAAHPEFVRQALAMVKVIDVNDATIKLFGAQSKEELMTSLPRLVLPETEQLFAHELCALAEGRTSFTAETVRATLKGDKLSVLLTIAFPPQPAKFGSTLVSIMDITERKRAEYLTRQMFESAADGVAVIGRDYRYQRVNAVYERNWRMPAEKIVGMHVADLLGTEVFERTMKPSLDRCLAGEQFTVAEWFTTELGRFYLSVSYSPLRLDSERLEAALVITRDLTDHVLASEALREAQAALARVNRVTTLGVLAASIAHEVNQPLGAMVASAGSCARWLGARPPELEKAQRSLERIARDGKRASEVIDRIRALVMRQPPRRDRVDVNQTILDVIALTRDQMRRNDVALEKTLAEGLPPVWGDKVQLQQVILNLIVNAVEAMSAPGDRPRQLVIGASEAEGGVCIEVRDSGPGIVPEIADKLFEPFHTSKAQGIGMGLSISQSIIEAHGGKLWSAPNLPHGAVFRFSLPVGEREP